MSKLVLTGLLLLSVIFNVGWAILDYCKGDMEIKDRLMIETTYDLLDRGLTSEDISIFQARRTLPHQKNILESYGQKYGWAIQVNFKNERDVTYYYFYSEDAGDELDRVFISNDQIKSFNE